MSDAKKQSVETCKYYHNWDKAGFTVDKPDGQFYCKTCKHQATNKEMAEAEAIVHLREVLKPGDTVYTVLRHVSRSGMSRNIDLYYIKDNKPVWISAYVGCAIGSPQSKRNWERSQGLTVGGCGMDMGFHLVYSLGRVLYRDGFEVEGRGRNGDTSGHDKDGGYALEHRWI